MTVFFKGSSRILFVHIPKTAGTSVNKFFLECGYQSAYLDGGSMPGNLNKNRLMSPQHMHSDPLRSIFKLETFDVIFSFTRHPVDRILSEYKFRIGNRLKSGQKFNPPSPDQWIRRRLIDYKEDNFIMDNHIRPQCEFEVENHIFFKFEHISQGDWRETLSSVIGDERLRLQNIEKKQISKDFSTAPSISPETIKLIRKFYEVDFHRFGYE